MEFSSVCRMCLSNKRLNPIFKNNWDNICYSTNVYKITGVKVSENDGLPQNMCAKCVNYVNKALKFRKKCKNVEAQLLLMYKESSVTVDIKDENNIENISLDNIDNTIETISNECLNNIDTDFPEIPDTDYYNVEYLDVEFIDMKYPETEDKTNTSIPQKASNDVRITRSLKSKPNSGCTADKQPLDAQTINTDILAESRNPEESIETLKEEIWTDIQPETQEEKSHRVICNLCQKELSIRSIDTHMAKQHPGADGKVKCDLCDTYITPQKMNRHKILRHGKDSDKLRCGYCKLEYETEEALKEHVPSCTAKKRKKKSGFDLGRQLHECDICHKKMQKASLRMHKQIIHAGLRPACEHCGRRFGNKFRLAEHCRAKHGYVKYSCPHCDFRSASTQALRNHERRHRGEKPFVCERCGAKFHAAYLLTQHRQSHRTYKQYKCDKCSARFKANSSLHTHRRACHARAAHACCVCARAFACRHYAVKHLRAVHRFTGPIPPLQRVPLSTLPDESPLPPADTQI